MNQFQSFIATSRYAKWIPEENRRESWEETITRYMEFMKAQLSKNNNYNMSTRLYNELYTAIHDLDVMPSMRALMMAGPAAERNNITCYNCSYLPLDSISSFDELMYILMCGTGVGYSVEHQYIDKLPKVPETLEDGYTIVVEDSREGWAKAYHIFLKALWDGKILEYDLHKIRPAGARLMTTGGRASGPEPLDRLFKFTIETFKKACGRKLTSLECHDLACKIAEIVVVGGVRRCLPQNAPIQMDVGYKKIKDVQIGDNIFTNGESHKVTGKMYSGKQNIYRIKHRFGEFECTANHRVAVYNNENDIEFKRAIDLVDGDILVADTYGNNGEVTYLPEFENSTHYNSKHIKSPELNSDLAWLIGFVHGDGYVSDKGIELSGNSDDMYHMEYAKSVIEKLFGISGNISGSDRGKEIRLRVNSVSLANWFKKYIKTANTTIHIPDFIFNSTREIRGSYLAGLFDADGRSKVDGGLEQVTTIYKEYSEEISQLLYNLGILSNTYFGNAESRRNCGVKAKDFYTITIVGNTNKENWLLRIGKYCHHNKVNRISCSGPIDFGYLKEMVENKPWIGSGKHFTSKSLGISNRTLQPVMFISRELIGEDETYDIEVSDVSQFTYKGIIVHNSACISLSDLSDTEMRDAKSGDWWFKFPHRGLSNNSAVYNKKPSKEEFDVEWQALVDSHSGERGIFNREASQKQASRWKKRKKNTDYGCNPSLRAGTKVWTTEGVVPIETLEDKHFYVRNLYGNISEAKCWKSGTNKQLYKITLKGGKQYYCTPQHKWPIYEKGTYVKKLASEIKKGDLLPVIKTDKLTDGKLGDYDDGFLIGWNLGDGWITKRENGNQIGFIVGNNDKENKIDLYIQNILKEKCDFTGSIINKNEININNTKLRNIFKKLSVANKREGLPQCVWSTASEEFRKGLIDGIFSSDGYVDKSPKGGQRIVLSSAFKKFVEDVADLLGFYGIKNSIVKTTRPFYIVNGKKYDKETTRYDLKISESTSIMHFKKLFKLHHKEKQAKIDNFCEKRHSILTDNIKIIDIELSDVYEDVWDISVKDETHCFQLSQCITGNCSEIILKPNQFCNLSEVVVRPSDTLESLKKKVRIATIFGTLQSTLTNFAYIRPIWKENTEQERLLGVSLTGIFDNIELLNNPETLNELRSYARSVNKRYAQSIGVPESVAITCCKPSGTVSCLVDSASGIHPRWAKYYIRNVRCDNKDPITDFLKAYGVPNEPESQRPNDVTVFSFPMKGPEKGVYRKDLTAIEHLEYWKLFQIDWCEHKPSVTINVKDSEWDEVREWVYENFDICSGVSFLPYSDSVYLQAPFIEISEEDYNKMMETFPNDIDWTDLRFYEHEDTTKASQTFACTGNACEVVDLTEK